MAAHIRDGVVYEGSANGGKSNLEELNDVNLQNVQDNQALVYDAENNEWVNGNTLSNLEELTDVDLIDVQDGQALVYDATNEKWVNGESISGDWVGTYEEYKALPDSKLTDGKTYFITDYPSDVTISNIEANTIRVGDLTKSNVFINKNEIIATETSGNMMGGGGTTYVSGTGVSVSKGSIMGMSTYGVDGIKINEVNGSYNNGLTTTMGLVLNGSSAKGIDSTPTKDSANLVTSGGVESSISAINSNLSTEISAINSTLDVKKYDYTWNDDIITWHSSAYQPKVCGNIVIIPLAFSVKAALSTETTLVTLPFNVEPTTCYMNPPNSNESLYVYAGNNIVQVRDGGTNKQYRGVLITTLN